MLRVLAVILNLVVHEGCFFCSGIGDRMQGFQFSKRVHQGRDDVPKSLHCESLIRRFLLDFKLEEPHFRRNFGIVDGVDGSESEPQLRLGLHTQQQLQLVEIASGDLEEEIVYCGGSHDLVLVVGFVEGLLYFGRILLRIGVPQGCDEVDQPRDGLVGKL